MSLLRAIRIAFFGVENEENVSCNGPGWIDLGQSSGWAGSRTSTQPDGAKRAYVCQPSGSIGYAASSTPGADACSVQRRRIRRVLEREVSNEDWAMVAAVGQAIAAVAAVFGLWFVGCQIRYARKTADLQALQQFLKGVTEREDRLLNPDPNGRKQAFYEFLNRK